MTADGAGGSGKQSAGDDRHDLPASAADNESRSVSLRGLANRLKLPRASARRIAILDLLSRPDPEVPALLLAHLAREDDLAARLRIIDFLGESRYSPSMPLLRQLASDTDRSPDESHAARIAADRIERAQA